MCGDIGRDAAAVRGLATTQRLCRCPQRVKLMRSEPATQAFINLPQDGKDQRQDEARLSEHWITPRGGGQTRLPPSTSNRSEAAWLCASLIWTATGRQISPSTGESIRLFYCYPVVHYDYWRRELPGQELPMGVIAENFTTDDLLEDSVHLGDRLSVSSAEVVVTQPRLPCYKLGVRFQSDDMVKRFFASRRTGFYLAVARQGKKSAPAMKSR